ncbi:MFS transporter [Actinomycetospora cinnamomea]|uniref:Putative MFS family arabinose efflux permease n=1 Tax=Actinomycetospora cinnamomea TaxID=663609 RepID=A0A2U1FFE8_9PSEU|nr:MFS transporter [Actinomycetospora cinnamomea]PVZ10914.1 putative MFS family arabinose efflux permease [Actinomycetospora cinnamomea]
MPVAPGPIAPARAATSRGPRPVARLRELLVHPGFGKLLTVRLAAQWGDGVFQAALGGLVLFSPEREADPVMVALGLATVLLPYSIVGPFAGALLDRWDRKRVMVVAGALRGTLTLLTALVVLAGITGPPLYLGALATIGVSRFIQAGLSAALPHVVADEHLVGANSLVTTSGAVAAAIGAGCAIGLRGLFGPMDADAAWTTMVAAVGSMLIVVVAARIPRGSLGPDERREAAQALRAVASGLVDGARAAREAPGVVAAFCAVAAHRLAFGVTTLVVLLLMRYALTDVGPLKAGIAGLGEVVVAVAAGLGVAAVVTPWLTGRVGRAGTVRIMLVLAAVALLALGLPMTLPTILAGSFVLGLVGQAIKLCSDAAVQREVGDAVRGRVFSLSDTTFNVTYVLAVAGAAFLAPPDGRSPLLLVLAAGLYLLGLVVHEWALRTQAQGGTQPAAPSAMAVSTAPSASVSTSSTSHRADGDPGSADR